MYFLMELELTLVPQTSQTIMSEEGFAVVPASILVFFLALEDAKAVGAMFQRGSELTTGEETIMPEEGFAALLAFMLVCLGTIVDAKPVGAMFHRGTELTTGEEITGEETRPEAGHPPAPSTGTGGSSKGGLGRWG
mmetsp:Transcript_36371/g.102751  ORF Transcript_36371/g.102751 Transcript_36371/m.102751 type:complete len:136 (+) Transcript_36371:417-824(+)